MYIQAFVSADIIITMAMNKKKRSYSIDFKISVVEEYNATASKNNLKIAQKYGLAPKRVREWRKQYPQLKKHVSSLSVSLSDSTTTSTTSTTTTSNGSSTGIASTSSSVTATTTAINTNPTDHADADGNTNATSSNPTTETSWPTAIRIITAEECDDFDDTPIITTSTSTAATTSTSTSNSCTTSASHPTSGTGGKRRRLEGAGRKVCCTDLRFHFFIFIGAKITTIMIKLAFLQKRVET